jgi:hypothetical protein
MGFPGLLPPVDEWLIMAARFPPPWDPRADECAGRSVAVQGSQGSLRCRADWLGCRFGAGHSVADCPHDAVLRSGGDCVDSRGFDMGHPPLPKTTLLRSTFDSCHANAIESSSGMGQVVPQCAGSRVSNRAS